MGDVPLLAGTLRALRIDIRNRDELEAVDLVDRLKVVLADAATTGQRDAKLLFRAQILLSLSPSSLYVVPHTLHESGFVSGSRSPHWHIHPILLAGTPTTSA